MCALDHDVNQRLAASLAREIAARSEAEAAEARLRAVIEASPLAIVSLDVDGRVTSWNAAAESIFGWSEDEVLGRPSPTVDPSDREASQAVRRDVLAGNPITGLERRRRRKDGSTVDVTISTAPYFDRDGRPLGTVVLAEDDTSRRRQERERIELLAAERDARERAEATASHIARLQSISAALSEAYTPPEVADVILTQGIAALGASAGSIYRWDTETEELHMVAAVGYQVEMLERFAHLSVDAPLPIARTVATRQPLWIESRAQWERMFEVVRPARGGDHTGASASIPLLAKGAVLGAIGLSFEDTRTFDEDERQFALSLTQQCAQALDRARLYEAERMARARAETAQHRFEFLAQASITLSSSLDYATTLASVARLAVPHIADWCSVNMVNGDGVIELLAVAHIDPEKVALAQELTKRYPVQPDDPTGVAKVIRSGEPEYTPFVPDELLARSTSDPERLAIYRELGLVSVMIVPLLARGSVLGALTFVSSDPARLFSESDLMLATDLARRAAIAVDNARLLRAAEKSALEREAILGQIADGIVIADARGTPIFANAKARELLGRDETDTGPPDYFDILGAFGPNGEPIPEAERLLVRATRKKETIVNEDVLIRCRDGREAIVECSATPVIGDGGETIGGVVSFRDVTSQRTLVRQKDDFLSAAAHDLKTPLTTIKGLAQILHRRAERADTEDTRLLLHGLERINTTSTRMSGLINELLDVSRIHMGGTLDLVVSEVDLTTLLERVIEEQQHTTELHSVELERPEVALTGHFDEARIERAFANLLSNAITYSPGGGRVTVRVDVEDALGSTAVIAIEDEGVGIPEDDLPHVFDRFHRGSNVAGRIPGTGIGLAGARDIFHQHGGNIIVRSREGHGTTFVVRLPLRRSDDGGEE